MRHSSPPPLPIFDGHNDLLARLWLSAADDPCHDFCFGHLPGQIDFARMRRGQCAGGLFAIFVPPLAYVQQHAPHRAVQGGKGYSDEQLLAIYRQQIALVERIEQLSQGQAKLCRNAADVLSCLQQGVLAMVLHLEGADGIDADFAALEQLYDWGLRSIGPLWNTPSRFGHGLSASFPHSPDTGAGLTPSGLAFIRYCAQKRLPVDVSHMNLRAFWQTADCLQQPLIATHSNVHALCPQARNLNAAQLKAIADSQGVVGVNFDTAFLRADGRRDASTPLSVLLAHLEHLLTVLGEDGVALGSDYDGGFMAEAWADISTMPVIFQALAARGYSQHLLEKIAYKNWLQVLRRIWGA
jgi:membrane dipeptidase